MRPSSASRLDALVDATPETRDRLVDFSRALSIVAVTLWHWTLSVTHRTAGGDLVAPNPVHTVPGAVYATWLLQVMPLFFLVGGYAAAADWASVRTRGRQREGRTAAARAFVAARARRVLLPTAVWAACWLAVELVLAARPGPHRWVWQWFPGYVVPLWFVGAYLLLVAVTPVTAPLQGRRPWVFLAALGAVVAATAVTHEVRPTELTGPLMSAAVWLLVWQLGVLWRQARVAGVGPRAGLVLAAAGLVALLLLSRPGGYPTSAVAIAGGGESNMWPTTPMIAAAAVLQLGLLLLLDRSARPLLRRRPLWRAVVAVNAVAVTIFVWHMTALLAVILAVEAAGAQLLTRATADWWLQRPFWVLAPAVVLLALLAVFGPVERAARRRA